MARRTHGRVGTDLWNEDSYRDLTCEEQWAYEFALLQPGLNRCGVVDYRPSRWAKLAKGMTPKRLNRIFARINETRHVVLDADFEQLLVRTYVKHDGLLAQPMVVAAMVSDFREISSPKIRVAFLNELRRIWHLSTLPENERNGLALAFGAQADAPRVRRAIGEGLVAAMGEAIAEGSVKPFSGPFTEALPEASREPFTIPYAEPLSQPPYAQARAGARPSSGSDSGSDSGGSAETPDQPQPANPPDDPEPPTAKAGKSDQPDDAIAAARRRAGAKTADGWDRETVLRICHGAASKFDVTASDAYDRLEVLAAMSETNSPGRLLDDGAWAWAGGELLRMARDRLHREQTSDALKRQKAEHEETAAVLKERRRRIRNLTETDPDGWAAAQVQAAAELAAEGAAAIPPLVAARALDSYDKASA